MQSAKVIRDLTYLVAQCSYWLGDTLPLMGEDEVTPEVAADLKRMLGELKARIASLEE